MKLIVADQRLLRLDHLFDQPDPGFKFFGVLFEIARDGDVVLAVGDGKLFAQILQLRIFLNRVSTMRSILLTICCFSSDSCAVVSSWRWTSASVSSRDCF